MTTMQRIDELTTPPIIGHTYLVPCVRITGPVGSRKRLTTETGPMGCEGLLPGWWPVIGPEHEDAAIFGFPHQHWHYDLRFLGVAQVKNRCRRLMRMSSHEALAADLLSMPLTNHGELDAPSLRPRRCLREQPDWDTWLKSTGWMKRPDTMQKLERVTSLKGQTLKTCAVCPHRGLPIGSMPVVDGIITCPGHGLRWRAATGELVRSSGPLRSLALCHEPVRIPLIGDNPRCADIARTGSLQ